VCLPLSLSRDDIDRLDAIVQRRQPLQAGDMLYRAGDPFEAIYAVRSGAIKTWTTDTQGREQITGFYLPGDITGLDGPAENYHTNSAQILTTSSVCKLPYQQLESLGSTVPGLQRNLMQLLSREIVNDQAQLRLISRHSAQVRVATFLLDLSARQQQQQLSATEFTLPMSRGDIANFLGLTLETVSRTFSFLQKQQWLHVEGKHVQIINLDQLHDGAQPH
jgi:CRP/FNR family transcriptional regulator